MKQLGLGILVAILTAPTAPRAFAGDTTTSSTESAPAKRDEKADTASATTAAPPPAAATPQIGPRRGLLRDAGRFKVEMISRRKGIEVYLINQSDKRPVIDGSRVEGQLYVGKKEYELKFRALPGQKRFHADWPDRIHHVEVLEQMNQGKEVSLVILPTRDRVIGAPVLYKIEKIDD